MTDQLPQYVRDRIRDRGLHSAQEPFRVTVSLYDRDGRFVSTHEMTACGCAQQEDILQSLENDGVITPMAEYYFLNWPKSLRLLLCELEEDAAGETAPKEPGPVSRHVTLELREAQLCCCPE